MAFENKKLKLISTAFKNNGDIPSKYTCQGENINPPLHIADVPEETRSLVLIMDDPDAPNGTFDHWLVWNISPQTEKIEENSVPPQAIEGINDFGKHSYGGPCPPSGTHRYFFKLYALNKKLTIPATTRKSELFDAIKDYVIDYVELVGNYSK